MIRRNQELYASLPSYAQYKPDMWEERDISESFFAALQYLDVLYNEFMLHRTLVRRLNIDNTELLLVTQKVMKIVLESVNVRSCHVSWGCVPWIVSFHNLFFSLSFPSFI